MAFSIFPPYNSHISCVISGRLGLFITAFMLLVYNYESQVVKWSKKSRSCTYGNFHLSSAHSCPLIKTFCLAQTAVHNADFIAETGAKPAYRLRSESYLRHQHDRSFPLSDNFCNRL